MEIASLADLLHETSERHGAFEAVAPPHDWWDWYAAYMDARQAGSSPDEASAAAGRYMAEAKGIVLEALIEAGRETVSAGPHHGRSVGGPAAAASAHPHLNP